MYGRIGTRQLSTKDAELLRLVFLIAPQRMDLTADERTQLAAMRQELIEVDQRDERLSNAIQRSYEHG